MKAKYTSIISVLILLVGCGSPDRPVNLTIAKQQVEQYYESGSYENDLRDIVDSAINHFSKISVSDKSLVIFDVDDTVLSDYADAKAISFGYIPKLSHEWVLRADAPAVLEVKRLYDYLIEHKLHIIFMTGRKFDEHDATTKNLKLRGFTHFDKLIVRERHELKLTARAYKSGRRKQLTQEGYTIVGCIGDQKSDLEGGYAGYQVKLPNYKYLIQ